MNTKTLALTALLIATLIIGCGIITGTFTIVYEVEGLISSTEADLQYESIDLNTIDDYQKHKDKIKSVDHVAVVGTVFNWGNTPVSGEIWLAYDSTYTRPDTVRHYGTRVFVSPVIEPGELLEIEWEDGLSYIENFPAIQDAVEVGQFVIYGLGDSQFFYVVMDIDIIVTVTAGY